MAVSTIPTTGLSLRFPDDLRLDSVPAVLVRLSENVVQDIRRTSREKNGVQFVTGAAPKLRLGSRTVDLNLMPDTFRTELYLSSTTGPHDLAFSALISHRAEVKPLSKDEYDTSGSDAALAALKSKMASYQQERQANQTSIVSDVLSEPKNRWEAAAAVKSKSKKRRTLATAGPDEECTMAVTPKVGMAPTSVPVDDGALRTKAMKSALVHLLAIRPATTEHILQTTHIPKNELTNVLAKIGKQEDGKWQLTDRAFKDLDVYGFGYRNDADRKAAVDNAIRSYDRLRVAKDEKIWQLLLPVEERNKGIVLSKLNLGAGHVNRGLTPHYQPNSTPNIDWEETRPASAANTPRLGTSPRPASGKGGNVIKRLLAKDSKKSRDAEVVKEKKRKEREGAREAAQSDREGARLAKRPTTKANNPKVKSAEFVLSSSDESEASSDSKALISRVDSKTSDRPAVPKEGAQTPSEITVKPRKLANTAATKSTAGLASAKPAASTQRPAASTASTAGKATPVSTTTTSAPNSKRKSKSSPQKAAAIRPVNPSPLGPARPRGVSDVSERSSAGVKRAKPGSDSPKGLGITTSTGRKRQATITSTDSSRSSVAQPKNKANPASTQQLRKPFTSGTARHGDTHHPEPGIKRKGPEMERDAIKHRKTGSTSSQSQSSVAQSTARTSPDPAFDSGSSGSPASVGGHRLSYEQGVDLAEKFQRVLYPKYTTLYDKLAEKKRAGQRVSAEESAQLMEMHQRLEQMKRAIRAASQLQ